MKMSVVGFGSARGISAEQFFMSFPRDQEQADDVMQQFNAHSYEYTTNIEVLVYTDD